MNPVPDYTAPGASETAMLQVRIPAKLPELPGLMQQLDAFAVQNGWQHTEHMQIQLLVEEVVVNVMHHGMKEQPNPALCFRVWSLPNKITLEFTDNGVAFNPLLAATPDLEQDVDARPVGGLGIHFVQQMADSASYARVEDDGQPVNRLRLSRNRN